MSTQTSNRATERMVDVGRGIELCVQTAGDPSAPPLLLIHGLAMQHIAWPEEFVAPLLAEFHVIRFDNRDIGLSSRAAAPAPNPVQLVRRRFDARQYDIGDMALDTANLLDALDVGPAHVVGVSMGGMIGQTVAARYSDKVRSLTSIMSTTGSAKHGQPARSTLLRLAQKPATARDAVAARHVAMFRHIGSRGYPFDEAETRLAGERAFDRAHDPDGVGRQLAAIMKSGNRTREVAQITAPTLVIHGDDDRMVHATGGAATAAAIPGARLESIPGMGHDFPRPVRARIAAMIVAHAEAADAGRGVDADVSAGAGSGATQATASGAAS